jgi:hypothetical protein
MTSPQSPGSESEDVATADVIHEEIIIHQTVWKHGKGGWKGECRIMGNVIINGQAHDFEKVVPIRFRWVLRALKPSTPNDRMRDGVQR